MNAKRAVWRVPSARIHATGFILIWFGVDLYGPGYPAWRHAVMALVDASMAWAALRHPRWLFVALVAVGRPRLGTVVLRAVFGHDAPY